MDEHERRSNAASTISAMFRGSRDRTVFGRVSYDWYDAVPPPFSLPAVDEPAEETDEMVYRSINIDIGGLDALPVIQVGGHGMLKKDETSPEWLIKEVPHCEMAAYMAVQGTPLEEMFAGARF